MVASGEVLVVRTVASAGLRGAVGNRLSPIVKALSPSAKTCHHLPRAASFSRRVWRETFRRNCDLFKGRVSKFLADNMLGWIDILNQAGMRSVSRDLLLENEGEGIRGPVTVCHINFEAWRTKDVARDGSSSSMIPSLALRAGVRDFMFTRGLFNTSPKRERGDLGREVRPGVRRGPEIAAEHRASNVAMVARPFRALRYVWRPVPRALPWAAMGRTFGGPEEICGSETAVQRRQFGDAGRGRDDNSATGDDKI